MAVRALVVILAYALSGAGFIFMLVGGSALVVNEPGLAAKLVPLIWLFAWAAHVYMSIAWIRDRGLSRQWPIWGTAAGIVSLATPLFALLGNRPGSSIDHLQSALVTIGVVSIFFLPSILLAVHLVRFHLSAGPYRL